MSVTSQPNTSHRLTSQHGGTFSTQLEAQLSPRYTYATHVNPPQHMSWVQNPATQQALLNVTPNLTFQTNTAHAQQTQLDAIHTQQHHHHQTSVDLQTLSIRGYSHGVASPREHYSTSHFATLSSAAQSPRILGYESLSSAHHPPTGLSNTIGSTFPIDQHVSTNATNPKRHSTSILYNTHVSITPSFLDQGTITPRTQSSLPSSHHSSQQTSQQPSPMPSPQLVQQQLNLPQDIHPPPTPATVPLFTKPDESSRVSTDIPKNEEEKQDIFIDAEPSLEAEDRFISLPILVESDLVIGAGSNHIERGLAPVYDSYILIDDDELADLDSDSPIAEPTVLSRSSESDSPIKVEFDSLNKIATKTSISSPIQQSLPFSKGNVSSSSSAQPHGLRRESAVAPSISPRQYTIDGPVDSKVSFASWEDLSDKFKALALAKEQQGQRRPRATLQQGSSPGSAPTRTRPPLDSTVGHLADAYRQKQLERRKKDQEKLEELRIKSQTFQRFKDDQKMQEHKGDRA